MHHSPSATHVVLDHAFFAALCASARSTYPRASDGHLFVSGRRDGRIDGIQLGEAPAPPGDLVGHVRVAVDEGSDWTTADLTTLPGHTCLICSVHGPENPRADHNTVVRVTAVRAWTRHPHQPTMQPQTLTLACAG